jgi:hypothetical protein
MERSDLPSFDLFIGAMLNVSPPTTEDSCILEGPAALTEEDIIVFRFVEDLIDPLYFVSPWETWIPFS